MTDYLDHVCWNGEGSCAIHEPDEQSGVLGDIGVGGAW